MQGPRVVAVVVEGAPVSGGRSTATVLSLVRVVIVVALVASGAFVAIKKQLKGHFVFYGAEMPGNLTSHLSCEKLAYWWLYCCMMVGQLVVVAVARMSEDQVGSGEFPSGAIFCTRGSNILAFCPNQGKLGGVDMCNCFHFCILSVGPDHLFCIYYTG